MGGAQPLAAKLAGAVFIGIEVDEERVRKRKEMGYLDVVAGSLDDALRLTESAARRKEALSVGVIGNVAEILPELFRRSAQVDVLTDQTSAHDPLIGYRS